MPLLDESEEEDRIMKAELLRELGEFGLAKEALKGVTSARHKEVVCQLHLLCDSGDTSVREVWFSDEHAKVALCLRCGDVKNGAWTACSNCGHVPEDDDLCRQLFVSDLLHSRRSLASLAAEIKAGLPLPLPVEGLHAFMQRKWKSRQRIGALTVGAANVGCAVLVLLVICLLVKILP